MPVVDLALIAVGGVQSFIAESRKTVDAAGASLVMRSVVTAAARLVDERVPREQDFGLVLPTPSAMDARSTVGVTNRVAFVAPAGSGVAIAQAAVAVARSTWMDLVTSAYGGSAQATPGMPELSWVSVRGDVEDYARLWERAQEAMTSRRRSRVFDVLIENDSRGDAGDSRVGLANRTLCGQSPRLPAGRRPPGTRQVERREWLSVAGWTKRAHGRTSGLEFPSTHVVASAVFRSRLIERAVADDDFHTGLAGEVAALDAAARRLGVREHRGLSGVDVPADVRALSSRLGTLIDAETWEVDALRAEFGAEVDVTSARAGAGAAGRVARLAVRAEIPAPTPYYAVVVQDLDHLGRRFGELDLPQQRAASAVLSELGGTQSRLAGDGAYQGVPVYAGGDDFLCFVPATTALAMASHVRRATRAALSGGPLAGVTASTAVVFAHRSAPLKQVIATAQRSLAGGKDAVGRDGRSRDALAVVVRRRGGERARTILPWWPDPDVDRTAGEWLADLAPDRSAAALSGRLASHLDRDRAEFDSLAEHDPGTLAAEMRRLVRRQHGSVSVADALVLLGRNERVSDDAGGVLFRPVLAALVARFLAQECR